MHAPISHARSVTPPADHYRLLVEAVTDAALFVLDSAGRVVSWNTGAERLTHYAPDEALGRPFAFLDAPGAGVERARRALRAALENGRVEESGAWERKDGSVFAAARTTTALFEAGRHVGFAVALRDEGPTPSRAAQTALRAELRRLRAVVDHTADGVVVADTDGNLLEWNPAALRMHGYASADEVRRHLSTFVDTFVLARPGEPPLPYSEWPMPKLMRGEAVVDYELHVRRTDTGGEWTIRYDGAVVPDPDGGTGLVVLTLHDMTERRRAEAESRRAAELVRAVANGTTDAVFVKDHEGKYLLFNEAAARFVGKPVAEVLGKDDTALFDPESARRVMARDRRVMESGRAETEEEVLGAAGVTRTYQATKAPYRDAAGTVRGLVGISRDITERKRAEEASVLFRALIDRTTDVIEVIDPETGRFLDANESACLAHGYTRAEYLALGVGDIDPLVATRPWAEVMESVRRAENRTFESRHQRKDGSSFPVEVRANCIQLDREYLVAVVRDLTERKRGEEALERERALLRTLIDALPDAIWTKDADGRFAISNRAHVEMVGAASESAVAGKTGFDFHPQDLAQKYHADDLRVLHHGETVFNKEEPVRDGAGSERWHLVVKTPLRDRTGAVTGLVGISRNIQDRKEAEETLRASEARTQAVIQTALDCIIVIDHQGRILDFNPAAEHTFGYARADILGREMADLLIPPEHRGGHRAGMLHYLTTGEGPALGRRLELPALRKGGEQFVAELSISRNPGAPPTFTGFLRDVTDRKRAEEALRRAQERLRSVISSSPAVLYTLAVTEDRMRGIAWVSENVREMLGFAPDEVVGTAWWEASIHPEDRDRVTAATSRDLFASARVANEYRVRHRDGRYRWVRSEMRLVRGAPGEPVEVVGSWSDVTERKQVEEQFRQAQKMEAVGRLAGGIAHDFNNLLTIINGYAALLVGSIPPADPNHAAVAAIAAGGERAAGLTAQLLAFSRKAIIEPKILDLNDLVSQSAKLLRRLIGEDVTLATVLAPHLGRVKVDPGQIEQAVMNLAVNARDAMPKGGRLTIETRAVAVGVGDVAYPDLEPGRYIQLAVSDTGSGMTEEIKAQIFEPFFTTKEPGKGTGLGLATVYGIVKTYGGHVGVYSEIGIGTTFKLLFPTVAEEAPRSALRGVATAPRGTETVLLVEDDAGVRGVAMLALRMHGYTVLEAGSGAEAIRVLEKHPGLIHLLVTDVVMPGMGGREVAETVRGRRPGIKALYVSGYTDDAVVRHGIVEATDAFLQKPFTPLSLARKVRAVLDKAD